MYGRYLPSRPVFDRTLPRGEFAPVVCLCFLFLFYRPVQNTNTNNKHYSRQHLPHR